MNIIILHLLHDVNFQCFCIYLNKGRCLVIRLMVQWLSRSRFVSLMMMMRLLLLLLWLRCFLFFIFLFIATDGSTALGFIDNRGSRCAFCLFCLVLLLFWSTTALRFFTMTVTRSWATTTMSAAWSGCMDNSRRKWLPLTFALDFGSN